MRGLGGQPSSEGRQLPTGSEVILAAVDGLMSKCVAGTGRVELTHPAALLQFSGQFVVDCAAVAVRDKIGQGCR